MISLKRQNSSNTAKPFAGLLPPGVTVLFGETGAVEFHVLTAAVLTKPIDILAILSQMSYAQKESMICVNVYVRAGAEAHFILNDESGHEASVDKGDYQFFVEAESKLDYTILRNCKICTEKIGKHHFFIQKSASVNVFSFTHDGKLIQDSIEAELDDERSFFGFKGLAVLTADQQNFQKVIVRHHSPNATSRQYYKNILSQNSLSEFETQVEVDPGARGSDSHQLSRHLLLSENAKGISKPILKIDNDDVACAHGATVGQLQKDELFYLKSRGIAEKDAKYMLMYGFAEEIVEELKPESLKEQIESLIASELRELV